jgi:hypothetical protein
MIHRFGLGMLNSKERIRLTGLLAFVHDVEPLFLRRLEKRYSVEVVNQARGIVIDI